jgi:magnesium transporter
VPVAQRALDYAQNPAVEVPAEQVEADQRVWLDAEDLGEPALRELVRKFGLSATAVMATHQGGAGASQLDGVAYLGLRSPGKARLAVIVKGPLLITLRRREIPAVEALRKLLLDPMRGPHVARNEAGYLAGLLLERLLAEARDQLEARGSELEKLEEEALRGAQPDLPARTVKLTRALHAVERSLHSVLRAATRLREDEEDRSPDAVGVLDRVAAQGEDLLSHAERHRTAVSNVLSLHLGAASVELNRAMRLLTVIATAVLVPTLIAGVYGMNFEHMPELGQRWGYPFALGLMALSSTAVWLGFRRLGFVGPRAGRA